MTRPGLLGRSILASVLVAAVASAATAVLATNAARVSAEREQVRVADVDRGIVDQLEVYGRGRAGWQRADELLRELAASSERLIVISDVNGNPLVGSGASERGHMTLGAGKPTAVLHPLASILSVATSQIPAAYDALALPRPLLDARPAGAQLRTAIRRDGGTVGICLGNDPAAKAPRGLSGRVAVLNLCDDLLPAKAEVGGGAVGDLALLQNSIALEEHRCLQRRDIASTLVRVYGAEGSNDPDLLTLHLPQAVDGARVPSTVSSAWRDCATAVLTRQLEPIVAPRAVLYVSEIRAVERGLLDRIGGGRLVLALVMILGVAVAASLVASRRVLKPVRRLTAATQEMAAGRLDARVDVTGHDEVARLGSSFNDMAEALAEADDQRRRIVSDVAHELRTPLSNLRGYLEAGRDGVLERDDAWTESLLEEAVLLQHVVDDLAVLAQADAGGLVLHCAAEDIVTAVDTALIAMQGYAESRAVNLVRSGADSAVVSHDPIRARQIVANLLSNAVRHSPRGATVTVDVRTGADYGARSGVVIEVADRGEGIAEEHLAHVFERFFRADPSRARETGGSGLGLSIVEQLVEAHGGTVAVGRREGGGAVFTVWLPEDSGD